jgi:spermidine synthase
VTGLLLLSTSHISVHTWPEYGYAAFDVFSCSDSAQTKLAVDYILKAVAHKRKKMTSVERGYAELKTIDIPVYVNHTKKQIKVVKKLAEIDSAFQNIQVLNLEKFGKTLLIDGITQLSESDVDVYNDAILQPLRSRDREILILGGGDGFVAEAILRKNKRASVTIVDLDHEVIYCAREHFNKGKVFDNRRVTLAIGDALQFLNISADAGNRYDGIIFDLTDEPVGSGRARNALRRFYDRILARSLPVLADGGWVSSQAGVPKVKRPHISTYEVLKELFEKHLGEVSEQRVTIPSFLDKNMFLYGTRRVD